MDDQLIPLRIPPPKLYPLRAGGVPEKDGRSPPELSRIGTNAGCPVCPDLLRRPVALIHHMRLSLMKDAHADLAGTAWQEIGVKPSFGLSGMVALEVPLPIRLTTLNCVETLNFVILSAAERPAVRLSSTQLSKPGAPFKPSFGLSGIVALDVPLPIRLTSLNYVATLNFVIPSAAEGPAVRLSSTRTPDS
jgi:uncharacterized membrane protein